MGADLLASRELAWRLLVRDISARYRQSLLGIVWAFIPPIVMAAGLTLANEANIINVGNTDIPYPAYVLLSTALWQTFIQALNAPTSAMNSSKGLLAKINLPKEAPMLASVGDVLFNFGIKLLLIVVAFVWFKVHVTWALALAPLALSIMVLFGIMLGLLIAPFALLYQDVNKVLGLITPYWMLMTPVIYPVPAQGFLSEVVRMNPVTPLLVTTRELATTGVLTQLPAFFTFAAISVVGSLLAWLLFRLAMPIVIERIS